MTTLRLVSAAQGCNSAPADRAADDLERYAELLGSMSSVLRPIQYGAALTWVAEWRAYGFERNVRRWPDGKFYLLNRGYEFWRGHRVAFDRQVLTAIGVDQWDRHVIVLGHDEDFAPLEDDSFRRAPRRQLGRYAELIKSIARRFKEELRIRDGA